MALLGWSPEGEQEIFTKEELIKEFSETRLSKSPSMFDKDKLTWSIIVILKKIIRRCCCIMSTIFRRGL